MKKTTPCALAALLLITSSAHAHVIEGAGGFLAGLTHPVLGFDHLLAMLSVGMLSAQMGGRAIWTVPATFVTVMLLGGVLGMMDVPLISVEIGIAASVLALGVAIAAERKLPPLLAMLFVGVFAVFHGHAHGAEMPDIAKPALYALGFVSGTAGIHITGVFVGLIADRTKRGRELLRFAGAGIAGIGVHLLLLS